MTTTTRKIPPWAKDYIPIRNPGSAHVGAADREDVLIDGAGTW